MNGTNEGKSEGNDEFIGGNGNGNLDEKMAEECIGPIGLVAIVPLNILIWIGSILLVRNGLKQFNKE